MYIHKWWALSHNKCLWTHLLLEFPIAKNLRNYIPTPEFSRHTTVHQHAHFTSSLSLIPTHNKHIENSYVDTTVVRQISIKSVVRDSIVK